MSSELARKGFGVGFDLSSLNKEEIMEIVSGETLRFDTPYNSQLSIRLSNSGLKRVMKSSSLIDFLNKAQEFDFIVDINRQ